MSDSDDKAAELEALKSRVAELEQAAAPPPKKSSGCGGLLLGGSLAIVAVFVIVGALNQRTSADAPSASGPAASDYKTMCATAYVSAKKVAAIRRFHIVPADPAILKTEPRVRIQCAIADDDGRIGGVTADVICQSPLENSCVEIVSVVSPTSKLLYADQAKVDAEIKEAKRAKAP